MVDSVDASVGTIESELEGVGCIPLSNVFVYAHPESATRPSKSNVVPNALDFGNN
jgi:hypothetical protein